MAEVWTNHNVLFVHAQLDDRAVPYRAMRVLAHLRRRLGKRKSGLAAGIRRISKACRMNVHTIEPALYWLEQHGFIKIQRKAGKLHQYEFMLSRKALYIDHRLDDFGLTPIQFRVLCHMARLANECGEFFLSVKKFAKTCGMKRETVNAALRELEDQEFFTPYAERKNPMYILTLNELFPKPKVAKTTNGGMPDSSNGGVPETGNGEEWNNVVTSETGNTPCPKQATPLSEAGNSGVPETGNERLSFLRQSKEDNPMKASQHLSQAQDAASAALTDFSVGQKTEELPPRASPKPIETREQLIERLQKEFGATVDVQELAASYEKHLAETKQSWKNGRFVALVTEMHRKVQARAAHAKPSNIV